jgi:hypothetical protein
VQHRRLQISPSKKDAFLQQESGFRKLAARKILVAKDRMADQKPEIV